MVDPIDEVAAGEDILADEYNKLVRRCNREVTGEDFFEDEFGTQVFGGEGGGEDSQVVGFTLTEDMDNTTAGEASATIHKTWDPATESYTGSESGVVKDTRSIFGAATDTSKGLGRLRQGNGREIVDPYNIECP